jgi:protein-S-isoprenylcysteine O-methyltransferase Ste14
MSHTLTMPTAVGHSHSEHGINGRRLVGFAFGIGAQAFFAWTVVGLFSFLRYGIVSSHRSWLMVDSLLALQFAVPHSILLHPKTRSWLRQWMPGEFHGAFFCVCTCVSLLLIFCYWRSSPTMVWEFQGSAATLMLVGFYASWGALLYSISLTGLGFQTGWTQWIYWYKGDRMPRRDFEARSVYRFMRHPIYLSFLGLIWFTPTMSVDHALLTAMWTVYIYIGSVLKDQRLLFYLGKSYAEYMRSVPGYPLMRFGPLAKSRRSMDGGSQRESTSLAPHCTIRNAA